MNDCNKGRGHKKETFTKAAHVTKPAQNIVDIPFNDKEFEVDFKFKLDVDRVIFFVGTRLFLVFCANFCEVKAVILQIQVGDCELKDFFFPHLAINWDKVGS